MKNKIPKGLISELLTGIGDIIKDVSSDFKDDTTSRVLSILNEEKSNISIEFSGNFTEIHKTYQIKDTKFVITRVLTIDILEEEKREAIEREDFITADGLKKVINELNN